MPFTIILHIKCAVIVTYIFFVLIYEMLSGNAPIIHRNIPHIVNACSKAHKNILNIVVKIKIFLFLKYMRFFL